MRSKPQGSRCGAFTTTTRLLNMLCRDLLQAGEGPTVRGRSSRRRWIRSQPAAAAFSRRKYASPVRHNVLAHQGDREGGGKAIVGSHRYLSPAQRGALAFKYSAPQRHWHGSGAIRRSDSSQRAICFHRSIISSRKGSTRPISWKQGRCWTSWVNTSVPIPKFVLHYGDHRHELPGKLGALANLIDLD